METSHRFAARQVGAGIRARLRDIDEVDLPGAEGMPILPDLHSTKRTGAIVVRGESGIGHAGNFGFDAIAGYVAEARSRNPSLATHAAGPDRTQTTF